MAEIRKHKASSGQSVIAKALEEALGAAVRPATPGAPPTPGSTSRPPAGSATTVTSTFGSAGWTSVTPAARRSPARPTPHGAAQSEDQARPEDAPRTEAGGAD